MTHKGDKCHLLWTWKDHYCSFLAEKNLLISRRKVYKVLGEATVELLDGGVLTPLSDKEFLTAEGDRITLGEAIRTEEWDSFSYGGHEVVFRPAHERMCKFFMSNGLGYTNPVPGLIGESCQQ